MRSYATILVIAIGVNALAQPAPARTWVDSEAACTFAGGHVLRVQNSLPKGGGAYTDAAGNNFSYVIFWFRAGNDSGVPLELALEFPAGPQEIFDSPDSHIRIFLPPDAMTPDKIQMDDYGLTGLQAFLDGAFDKPGGLKSALIPCGQLVF